MSTNDAEKIVRPVINSLVKAGVRIVVGDCKSGVDEITWDMRGLIEPEVWIADWKTFGKAAGPKRNQAMVDSGADLCIAFPSKGSTGTIDCVERAKAAGIPVVGHFLNDEQLSLFDESEFS